MGHDVIVTEGPNSHEVRALDIWVLDEESMASNTHRSVILDSDGEILGDTQIDDD